MLGASWYMGSSFFSVAEPVEASEHRMVVGGMHGNLLKHVPVLDDPAALESVDVRDRGVGSAGSGGFHVHHGEVAVDEDPLDLEPGVG